MTTEKNLILWNMTKNCNFRCKYCYFPHDSSPIESSLPVDKILAFLQSTNREWTIGMTGGEPFIYPGFVSICRKLTKNHTIEIDTNLSIPSKIKKFAHGIDPKRVKDIYVALHIEERERTKGVESFIDNVLLLKEKSFPVNVNYVIHPTLVDRFQADREFYKSRGIKLIPRPFKGVFENKDYPLSYNQGAKALFLSRPKTGKKIVYNFKGVPCDAGRRLIRLEPQGDLLRCPGDRQFLGNITDSVKMNNKLVPCAVSRCPCLGLNYVQLNQAQKHLVSGLGQFMIGEYKDAVRFFKRTLEIDPKASNALHNIGVVLWEEGNREQVLSYFEKALEIHPYNKVYVINMINLLTITGRMDTARKTCTFFLKQHDDKEIKALEENLDELKQRTYIPKICVDVISDNTLTDIFKV